MPLISVILPTRDRPALIGRALASVLNQTETDFEVVLIDNNQRNRPVTEEPELQVMLRDSRVKVVRAGEAATAGAARNVGLAVATGEWITFLDDDDEYRPEKLARQLALARETDAKIVLCGYEVELGIRRRRAQIGSTVFSGDGLLLDAIWGTPFLFLRRDGKTYFDGALLAAEDFDLAQEYVRRHAVLHVPCVPEPLVVVHLQPERRVNSDHEAHWRALRRGLVRSGSRYTRKARRRFLLRALVQRHKGRDGSWGTLLGMVCRLVKTGGFAEVRRGLNAVLYRTGLFKRWLVS